MKKRVLSMLLVLIMAFGIAIPVGDIGIVSAKGTYTQISQETAMEMMKKNDGHVVVDVRRKDEYDCGHIPGAILIPNEKIGSTKPAKLPKLNQIILIYCRTGHRSKEAAQKLADIGYSRVYEFGGLNTWTGAVTPSSKPATMNPEYKKIELEYNSHVKSGLTYSTKQGLEEMLNDVNTAATYSVKIKNKKVAKAVKNKDEDDTLNSIIIISTGIGTTTGTIYEKLGNKKRKLGKVKINVKQGKTGDNVMMALNRVDNLFPNPIYLAPYMGKNTYDLGAQIESALSTKAYGVNVKKSEYTVSYEVTYDLEVDDQQTVPEEKRAVSVSDKGVITSLRPGYAYVEFKVQFKDKSVYSWNLSVEVIESSIVKEGKYNINNIRDYVVGLDTQVPLTGEGVTGTATQICFDNAATTPALKPVEEDVEKKLEMYGSIGRGYSEKSNYSTELYNDTRNKVLDFLSADRGDYACFYVNTTTDGLNKLASALITSKNDLVLTTRIEHHANDLSWRERCKVIYAEVDKQGRVKYDEIEKLLKKNKVKIVSISAASNVTGYVMDVHRVAKMAHKYGAMIVVDGAQIVAHRKFSMIGDPADASDDIDFIAFSAHKMYSPFGGGAVVGKAKELYKHMPTFYGGGTVDIVADNWVHYKHDDVAVYEAGSPNYPGVVGLGKAIDVLSDVGFDAIEEHEKKLNRRVIDGLKKLPNVIIYGDSENIDDRVGVVTFNFSDINTQLLAETLSEIGAVATRRGQFCAHPYVWRLMGIPDSELESFEGCASAKTPGMLRISFGIYNTEEEVDKFLAIMPKAMEIAKSKQENLDAVPAY